MIYYLPEDNHNDLFALTEGFQGDVAPSDSKVISELIGEPRTIIGEPHPRKDCQSSKWIH